MTATMNSLLAVSKEVSQPQFDEDYVCPICAQGEGEAHCEITTQTNCCNKQLCRDCLVRWFLRHPDNPTCPICNDLMNREKLVSRLGLEPYKRREPDVDTGEPRHDLTMDWLAINKAKQCPSCGVWITKDGGCPHMECPCCAFEFCWVCLESTDEVDCECEEEDETDIESETDEEDQQEYEETVEEEVTGEEYVSAIEDNQVEARTQSVQGLIRFWEACS